MKQLLLSATIVLSLILSTAHSDAQDLLKFKNGDELKVKVQEITPQEIKYKRFDTPNGPLITILKNTALSIQYENGVVEKLTEDAPPVTPNSYVNPTVVNAEPVGFGIGDIVEVDYNGTPYRGKIIEANLSKYTAVVDLDKNGKSQKVKREFYELTLIEKGKPDAVVVSPGYRTNNPGSSSSLPTGQPSSDLYFRGQQDAKRYYGGYQGAGTGTFFTSLLFGPIVGLIPAAACSSTPSDMARLTFPNAKLAQNMNYYTGYTEEAKRIKTKKVWSNYGIGSAIAIAVVIAFTSSYR